MLLMPAASPGTKFKFIFDTDTYHPLNSSPAGESQFQNPADGLYYARSWENMAVDKMVIYLKCHSVEMSGALRSRGAQGKITKPDSSAAPLRSQRQEAR